MKVRMSLDFVISEAKRRVISEGMVRMIVILTIMLVFIIILGIMLYKVKKDERLRRKNREKLLSHAVQLLDIQLNILLGNDACAVSDEAEIAKYLRDYILRCMVEGKYSCAGKKKMHGHVIKKYPEVFAIFSER